MITEARVRNGYTIVELLIVIVVIAILAAISVVAYTGIQDRAEVSKNSAAIRSYVQALEVYKLDTGTLPSDNSVCIGHNYPTDKGVNGCRTDDNPRSNADSLAFNNKLKPYFNNGDVPLPSVKPLRSGARLYVGAFYNNGYTLDGEPAVAIVYYHKGTACPVGPVYANGGGGFTSPAVDYTNNLGGGMLYCWILLKK